MSSVPSDGVTIAHRIIIDKAYSYVEKSTDTKHIAAVVAYMYNTSLFATCPASAPRSNICADPRASIPMHFNSPLGMKYLSAMLRHAFNFFEGHEKSPFMNWCDTEALADPQSQIYFDARSLRKKMEIAFSTLSGASGPSPSTTKVKAASHMFRMIEEYIRYPPRTLAEVRLADAADALARRAAYGAHGAHGGAGAKDDEEEVVAIAAAAPAVPAAVPAAAPAAAPAAVEKAVVDASPRAMDIIRGMGLEYITRGRNYQIKRIKNRAENPIAIAELSKCCDCTVEVIPPSSLQYFAILCLVKMN